MLLCVETQEILDVLGRLFPFTRCVDVEKAARREIKTTVPIVLCTNARENRRFFCRMPCPPFSLYLPPPDPRLANQPITFANMPSNKQPLAAG